MSKLNPPFRADQVGSLLRPKVLLDARSRYANHEITKDELRQVEDRLYPRGDRQRGSGRTAKASPMANSGAPSSTSIFWNIWQA